MNRERVELLGWIGVAFVLATLTIPWFLWGVDAVVAGLPVWLWWHVAWMLLASLVFWLFAQRAWGIGIERSSRDDPTEGERGRASSGRGESR